MFYVNVDYIPQSKDVECSIKTGDDNKIFVACMYTVQRKLSLYVALVKIRTKIIFTLSSFDPWFHLTFCTV